MITKPKHWTEAISIEDIVSNNINYDINKLPDEVQSLINDSFALIGNSLSVGGFAFADETSNKLNQKFKQLQKEYTICES